MNPSPADSRLPVAATMWCSGVLTAQFVASRAARDAVYLAQLDVRTLPEIVVATSICSVLLVVLSARMLKHRSPAIVVPAAFGLSALLFVAEWLLVGVQPSGVARVLYLHVSGLGPMLASGFWLIAAERFDPRAAKHHFGRIAGMGTLGGLLGGLLAERAGATWGIASVLPVLAVLNAVCAWQVRALARPIDAPGRRHPVEVSPELAPEPASVGFRALASARYLRHLAALVLLGTLAAALVDYVFKVQAVAAFGRHENLLRFFAVYYAAASLATFAVQMTSSGPVLKAFGLAAAASTPSLALIAGGVGGLLLPGLPAAVAARGGESVLRGSLYRASYEVFYAPISSAEKRAAKSIIDVGFDRLGDALGGGVVRVVQLLAATEQSPALFGAAIACSLLAIVAASRLNRGYVAALERSLRNRALELELSDAEDLTTRTAMIRMLGPASTVSIQDRSPAVARDAASAAPAQSIADAELQKIMELRSRDAWRVVRVLRHEQGVSAALVPHIVPLLAWDAVADAAVVGLRRVAEERVGELVDALVDPNQPFAVRRRLARVFSVCVSQRAFDGVMLGLDDLRFEVRFQSGRSLSSILSKNPRLRVDSARVLEAALREVNVSRPVWESRRLLDNLDEAEPRPLFDELVADRAGQSLAHVFTLLSLVLPSEPLRIAFRGLHTSDSRLRGTALEYLESILPPAIRERLWPFLEGPRESHGRPRPRDEVVADLLQSSESIMLNLEELRRARASENP